MSKDAEEAAAYIIGDLSLDGIPQIYLLWTLVEIAQCVGVWANADRRDDTPNVHLAVEGEARVAATLAAGLDVYVSLMSDTRADVRSLASILTALSVVEPSTGAQLLAVQEGAERDRLAKACALQALLIALARTPSSARQRSLVEYIRRRARAGTPEDRGRMRRVVEGHSGATVSQSAREVLADAAPMLSDPEGPYWSIELL